MADNVIAGLISCILAGARKNTIGLSGQSGYLKNICLAK